MRGVDYPSRVDLPTVVSGIIADVDGDTPTPWRVAPGLLSVASPVYITPDRRAEAAVLVGLGVHGASSMEWGALAYGATLSLTVAGMELVEGLVPVGALQAGETPLLPAPVVQSPSTPAVLRAFPLGAFTPATTLVVSATYLSCSARAAKAVARELGRARWWGLFATDSSTPTMQTLNVERGGRALWACAVATTPSQPLSGFSPRIARNGRVMIADGAAFPVMPGVASPDPSIAHDVSAGDVYEGSGSIGTGGIRAAWLAGVEPQ